MSATHTDDTDGKDDTLVARGHDSCDACCGCAVQGEPFLVVAHADTNFPLHHCRVSPPPPVPRLFRLSSLCAGVACGTHVQIDRYSPSVTCVLTLPWYWTPRRRVDYVIQTTGAVHSQSGDAIVRHSQLPGSWPGESSPLASGATITNTTSITVDDATPPVGAPIPSDFFGISSSYGDYIRLFGNGSTSAPGQPWAAEVRTQPCGFVVHV